MTSLIETGRVGRLDDDARVASEAHLKRLAPNIKSLAQVILGGGFMAAAARLLVTGQQMLTPPGHEWKIFTNVQECARWTGGFASVDAFTIETAANVLLHKRS